MILSLLSLPLPSLSLSPSPSLPSSLPRPCSSLAASQISAIEMALDAFIPRWLGFFFENENENAARL